MADTLTLQKRSTFDFFKVGGPLGIDAPSYVERRADVLLRAELGRHEYCLVLAPRQTGKSSLMVHAWAELQRNGVNAAIIDLQALGRTLDPEIWFRSVLGQAEDSLPLKTDLRTWWEHNYDLAPSQRFIAFLEDIVLEELDGDVVLFIDEIDSVLPLPFSDDVFTTIRSLYNARAYRPKLSRLSFVLIGFATPSAFIRDRSRTPFNIGVSIPLEDFDINSLSPFREALGSDSAPLIDRILHWTNGQPFMTQKLAEAVYCWPTEEQTPIRIDQEVRDMFLEQILDHDTHLKFIRDYLLDPLSNARETLGVYREILSGRPITENAQSVAHSRLKLAGVVAGRDILLASRNRIYATIFNLEWIADALARISEQTPLQQWLNSGRHVEYLLKGRPYEDAFNTALGRTDMTEQEWEFLLASTQFARTEERKTLKAAIWKVATLSVLVVGSVLLSIVDVFQKGSYVLPLALWTLFSAFVLSIVYLAGSFVNLVRRQLQKSATLTETTTTVAAVTPGLAANAGNERTRRRH